MKVAFLFPGQGAQYCGMAQDFYKESAAVRALFEECSDAVGRDMSSLLFESDEQTLLQTQNTQIAVMLASLSASRVLQDYGIEPAFAVGFSLGEYAALVVARVLSLHDACTVVMQRATIMEQCAQSLLSHYRDEGALGMTAILGMHPDTILDYLTQWNIQNVYLAMYNSPIQGVLAGTSDARSHVCEKLRTCGARKCIPLKVSGPFHTPFMRAAREAFSEVLLPVYFEDPTVPVFTNVTGAQVFRGSDIRTMCLDQIVSPVRWIDEEAYLMKEKPKQIVELGPGTVLSGLWKAWRLSESESDKDIPSCGSVGTMDDMRKYVSLYNESKD